MPFYKYEYAGGRYVQMRAYVRDERGLVSACEDLTDGRLPVRVCILPCGKRVSFKRIYPPGLGATNDILG